jgi:hypothetical protein
MFAFRMMLSSIALALALPAPAQLVPTQGAPPGPGTAAILGQVVDARTGAPVPEAIVQLTMPGLALNTPVNRVMADAEGRFFFAELPAGEFWLVASKDGYADGAFEQRRADGSGQRLLLAENERRVNVTLRVWKYAVISGTVMDEAGEPVVGVAVRALVRRIVAGRPQYGKSASYSVPGATTDDRGMFRLPRVDPGTYVVVVPSTLTTVPVSVLNGADVVSVRNELGRAGVSERTLPTPGHPRAQQAGDVVLLTMSSVMIPPAPSADGRMQVYRTTYYPAATTAAEATAFRMESGEERTDLAITLRPTPGVRIAGRLIAPDGIAPPPMSLRLAGAAMHDVATRSLGSSDPSAVGFETATGFSDADGRFTLLGVPAGEYVLAQANAFLISSFREGRQPFWLSRPITVGNADVTDLAVDVRPAFRVEGRLEFVGPHGPHTLPPGFGITLVVFETASGEPGQVAVSANRETLEFATVAAGGRYVVRPAEPRGWVVDSVTLNGKDITDKAFDLQADATSIVVTFTQDRSPVSGTVKDAGGNSSISAAVLVFPADRQRWTDYGSSPRDLKMAHTTSDGAFSFNHLPPGDYRVIAIEDAESDDWQDPQVLAALATRATTLSIAPGDGAKTVNLTVRSIR